jgi:ABC-type nitrate/sulfonate/bicarbonate transport system substrate-binding protein
MKTRALGIVLTAALIAGSLTACGTKESAVSTSQSSQETTQTDAVQTTAETAENNGSTEEAEALAEELLGRYVTEDDEVTEEVINAAIAKLKDAYDFEPLDDLKIQSTNWAYVAQGKGWFDDLLADNGTSVTVVEGSIGSEPQLMERGELDLANRMLYPYLLFKTQGADLTAVGISADPRAEIVSILVNKDSDITSFDDLKGKTIGSWNAGCQYVALLEQTEDRGWVEGTDWYYENISNDSLKTALQAGEIDAISVHPLTSFNGSIIDGSFREIANAKENGTYTNTGGASVSFTTTSFAEEHENLLKAVLKLRELVNAYILLYPDETGAVVEEINRVPAENTNFWNDRSRETFFASQESLEELIQDTDTYQDWLISHTKEFTEENRIDSSEYFNEKFFESAN